VVTDTSPPEPLTCKVKVAAHLLGLSNVQVYDLLDKGTLRGGYTPSGQRLVELSSVREFVATLPAKRPAKQDDVA
jgi:hypothetical protein